MTSLSQLLTEKERAAIRAPIEHARTFPRRAFIEEEFFRFEIEHVLTESWIAVGFGSSIPAAGDILPVTMLGCPVLLIRGKDGVARAFHNVCPYDGCEVSVAPQFGLDHIVAPYHGWTYDLEGNLMTAGFWDGTPDAANVNIEELNANLTPIPCHEWLHTLFIYLGNSPVAFEQQYAAVLDHFCETDLERLEIGIDKDGKPLVQSLEIKSNWKTVYENYSPNVYHESFVHEMYRKSPHSPRVNKDGEKTYTEINSPCGFLGLSYDNKIGDSLYGESRLPKVRNKDGSDNRVNTIANVFPNWVTTVLGDAARISIFHPDSPEHGTQMVATLFDRDGSHDPELASERKQSERKGIMARVEDNRICESIQRARHSPGVHSQFYSPFWDAMHYTLTNLILDRMEKSEK